jgi:hypothetical protein
MWGGNWFANCYSSLLCTIAHIGWSSHTLSPSHYEAWHLVTTSPPTYNFWSLTLHQSFAFMSSPLSYIHKVWVVAFPYFLKELGVIIEVCLYFSLLKFVSSSTWWWWPWVVQKRSVAWWVSLVVTIVDVRKNNQL